MKKYLLLCLLGVLPLTSWSQVVTNDEPDDEDEIIVTDQEGNEEVIEFPEAMTYDLDSLMSLYINSSTATADACAIPSATCWEHPISTCPSLRKLWRCTNYLWS